MGDGSRAEVAQLARGVVEGGVAQLGPDCEKKKEDSVTEMPNACR